MTEKEEEVEAQTAQELKWPFTIYLDLVLHSVLPRPPSSTALPCIAGVDGRRADAPFAVARV